GSSVAIPKCLINICLAGKYVTQPTPNVKRFCPHRLNCHGQDFVCSTSTLSIEGFPMKKAIWLVLLFSGIAVAAATGYHKTNEIKIGGAGQWDLLSVDSAARRLYVSHQSKVEVIAIDAGKKVGEVPNTAGVHGIAVAAALNKGFTTNGSTNDVTV